MLEANGIEESTQSDSKLAVIGGAHLGRDFARAPQVLLKRGERLGGKGASLAIMTSLGLPVPPGFTITTEVCRYFLKNNRAYPRDLEFEIKLAQIEI